MSTSTGHLTTTTTAPAPPSASSLQAPQYSSDVLLAARARDSFRAASLDSVGGTPGITSTNADSPATSDHPSVHHPHSAAVAAAAAAGLMLPDPVTAHSPGEEDDEPASDQASHWRARLSSDTDRAPFAFHRPRRLDGLFPSPLSRTVDVARSRARARTHSGIIALASLKWPTTTTTTKTASAIYSDRPCWRRRKVFHDGLPFLLPRAGGRARRGWYRQALCTRSREMAKCVVLLGRNRYDGRRATNCGNEGPACPSPSFPSSLFRRRLTRMSAPRSVVGAGDSLHSYRHSTLRARAGNAFSCPPFGPPPPPPAPFWRRHRN